ncbi:MAG TPA: zinc metalloprotease [Nocardioidaceae bacterium]|nr:zinc metalloprotease [Nocardioidaceae bacterium]
MRRSILGGLGTLAAVALLGSAVAPTASASMAKEKSAGEHCRDSANARVMKGTSKWADPNTLTRREAAAQEARAHRMIARSGIQTGARPNGSVKIRVHFHGVTDHAGHNFVTKKRFKRQINVLNKAFGGRTGPNAANTPFRFRLASIDRTKNNKWFNANYFTDIGKQRLRNMRRALHVGNARDLNLYTIGPNFQLLGLATFPADYQKFPRLDGSVLLAGSLPGGNANFGPGAVYNKGDTATHEIGHWLNLYHTFQGGCSQLNDYVTDTPKQFPGNNIFVCDTTLNTCPPFGTNDRDPVKNFMNYVDDPCMNQFTRGQRERMNTGWFIRRALS